MKVLREYIKSLRIFTAEYSVKVTLLTIAGIAAVFFVILLPELWSLLSSGKDFIKEFKATFLPLFVITLPVSGAVLLSSIYCYVNPAAQGYKYFHSIGGSAKKFKMAVIAGNIVVAAISALFFVILALLERFITDTYLISVAASFDLLLMGVLNLTAFVKIKLVRALGMVPTVLLGSFVGGFVSGIGAEEYIKFPAAVCVLIGAAVYIAGLVYVLSVCEKRWYDLGDKPADPKGAAKISSNIVFARSKVKRSPMKKGFELIIKRILGTKPKIAAVIVLLCVDVLMLAAVMIFHEAPGAEDYLVCKTCYFITAVIFTDICCIILHADISGGKLLRSSPIAKTLYTRCVPYFICALAAAPVVLMLIAYGLFCAVSGLEISNVSDMLILSASYCFIEIPILSAALSMNYLGGTIMMIYMFGPFGMGLMLFDGNIASYGFGMAFPAALIIFVAALAAGAAIGIAVSGAIYRKANFKAPPSA